MGKQWFGETAEARDAETHGNYARYHPDGATSRQERSLGELKGFPSSGDREAPGGSGTAGEGPDAQLPARNPLNSSLILT